VVHGPLHFHRHSQQVTLPDASQLLGFAIRCCFTLLTSAFRSVDYILCQALLPTQSFKKGSTPTWMCTDHSRRGAPPSPGALYLYKVSSLESGITMVRRPRAMSMAPGAGDRGGGAGGGGKSQTTIPSKADAGLCIGRPRPASALGLGWRGER
jgi:hypothetical protein